MARIVWETLHIGSPDSYPSNGLGTRLRPFDTLLGPLSGIQRYVRHLVIVGSICQPD